MTTPTTQTSEWKFSLGSGAFSPADTNYFGVILMSNNPISGSIISSTWSGYFLKIGANGSVDYIELWKKSGSGNATKVGGFNTPNYNSNALSEGVNLRITRSDSGVFSLYYSSGFTYASTPTTLAGTLNDNEITTSQYFGVFQLTTNPSAARRVYIDNIVLGSCTPPIENFEEPIITKLFGDPNFTNPFTTNSTGTKSFSSSNIAVATVDNNGEITIIGVGTTTITASTTANAPFCASTESYTLTVNPNSHTITYNGNGHTGGAAPIDPNSPYPINGSVSVLGNTGNLVKECSNFVGWNTSSNGSGISYVENDTFNINSDVILYAQWSSNLSTVTFNSNGGSGTMPNQSACVSTNLNSNTFTRTGYSFSGWNTAADGSGAAFANNALYNFLTSITLFAQWTPNQYTITFDGNGQTIGSPSISTITANYGSTISLAGIGTLVKTGYTFDGWATNAAGTGTIYPANSNYTISSANNITLYAKWNVNNYQVIFNGNGNDGGNMPNQNFNYNETKNLTNNSFSRTGYTFLNWNTLADGSGTTYTNGASYTMTSTSNVQLYAQWEVYVPPVPKRYDLVTSETQLVAGKKYLIVNSKSDGTRKAMSRQNGNNRYGVDVTVSNNKIFDFPANNPTDNSPFELTLGGESGFWTLSDNVTLPTGYLYSSYGQNYLRTQSSATLWTISIDTNGETEIKQVVFSGSTPQERYIKQNSSSATIFSAYTTGQTNVYLYVENNCVSPDNPIGEIDGEILSCDSSILSYNGSDKSNAYWVSNPLGQETDKPASTDLTVNSSGTYYLRIKVGECWSDGAISRTVVVNTAPNITTQPQPVTLSVPNSATFSVTAEGGDLSYQWMVSEDCGHTWSNIVGATNSSYTTPASTPSMVGNIYKVLVTNNCGTETSNEALLTVVTTNICLSEDFNSNATVGYTSGSYVNSSGTWIFNNVLVDASNSRAQLQWNTTSPAWIQLPDLNVSASSKAVSLKIYAGTSSSSGSGTIKVQYLDSSSNWVDITSIAVSGGNSNASRPPVDISMLTSSPLQIRLLNVNSGTNPIYIGKIEVECIITNEYTWTGNAQSTSWDDVCNWDPKGIPTEVDNVRFRFQTDATNTLNIIDNRTVNNLILDEQGVFDVASTGNFTVNGNITYSDTNGATANFDCQSSFNIASTSTQTVPTLNYGNLNAAGGDRNLVSNKTVGVCNTFTPGVGTYTMNQSTFNYNGNDDQIVNNSIEYYNLLITGSGVKTTAHGDLIVNGMTSIKSADAVLRVPRPGNIPDATPIPEDTTPNVFYALGGIDNTNGTTGKFVLSSDANFIQHNDSRNNADNSKASIVVERYVHDMDANNPVTTPVLWDYVYWSSPIKNHALRPFSPGTQANRFYEYRESNNLFYNAPENVFYDAKGYAIRAEGNLGFTYNKIYEFTGEPNNAMSYVSPMLKMENNGYNLVGNPYPSNIDLDALFATNESNIHSVAYFWTNNTPTYYQSGASYVSNSYAIYNGTGGVPATTNAGGTTDYNVTATPNGYAKVGQGFIVKAKTHNVEGLTFNTNMRAGGNDMFFHRQVKNRFWINLSSPSQIVNTILVGYVPGATNEFEQDFDTNLMTVGSDAIYSILGTRKLAIQGKEDNFQVTDVIPIGVKFFELGQYTIDIPTREGLFETQKIYLKDKYRGNSIHDFTNGGYTFKAGPGEFKDRFEIIFKRRNISVSSQASLHTLTDGKINIIKENDFISISSSNSLLKKVEIFNLSGRSIYQNQTINQTQLQIPAGIFGKEIFFVNVETSEGEIVSKKLINN